MLLSYAGGRVMAGGDIERDSINIVAILSFKIIKVIEIFFDTKMYFKITKKST